MGEIERFPGGRRSKTRAAAESLKPGVVDQARAAVASEIGAQPPALPTTWPDQSHPEKLSTLTGKALDTVRHILDLPCDPENLKLLSIQKDAALSILATQTKVDENRLRERRGNDEIGEILRRLAAADREPLDG
jgi:hypothetical protein